MDNDRLRTAVLTLTTTLGSLLLVLLCTAVLAWPARAQTLAVGPQADLECLEAGAAAWVTVTGPGTVSRAVECAALAAPEVVTDAASSPPMEKADTSLNGEIVLPSARDGANIAFVHAQDLSAALSFDSFLESGGYTVTLVPISDVLATDFSPFDSVMVGHDTGYLNEWPVGVSGVSAEAAHIEAPGVPVLGLGEGGYAFFGKLGLPIGSPFGWHGTLKAVRPASISASFWQTPTAIALPAGPLALYTSDVLEVGINLPSVTGVVPLGLESEDDFHAPLVGLQDSPHQLWGFGGSPDQMTDTGKTLFGNAVVFSLIHPDGLPPEYPVFLPAIRK